MAADFHNKSSLDISMSAHGWCYKLVASLWVMLSGLVIFPRCKMHSSAEPLEAASGAHASLLPLD